MKSKTFVIVMAVVLSVIGILYYFYLAGVTEVYRNKVLGYKVVIPVGWHVSESMSKKIDSFLFLTQLASSIGCDPSKIAGGEEDVAVVIIKLQDCMKKSPDLMKIESLNKDYSNNWSVEKSHNIFIVNLTEDEESKLTAADLTLPQESLPNGSFVVIRSFDSVVSFDEATSSSKTGLKRVFYKLGDKGKAYLTDLRDTNIVNGGMVLSIPIVSQEKVFTGEQVKSLSMLTTATKGSQNEKVFYQIVDSFMLYK